MVYFNISFSMCLHAWNESDISNKCKVNQLKIWQISTVKNVEMQVYEKLGISIENYECATLLIFFFLLIM